MFESRYRYGGEVKADITPMTVDDISRELDTTTQKVIAVANLKFLSRETGETLMVIPEGTMKFS